MDIEVPTFKLYSDESHHSQNNGEFMVIGSVWGNQNVVSEVKDKVNLIKSQHGVPKQVEIKWTKVSPAKVEYYKDLVSLFFKIEGLNFRAVIIPTSTLRHKDFQQTTDDFYYKMQYLMLSNISRKHQPARFNIYLDFKDTWSNVKAKKLAEYLRINAQSGLTSFEAQPIRSYESAPLQLTDLLVGAVAYKVNSKKSTGAKIEMVKLIESLVGQEINQSSPYGVDKFNILVWRPQ